MTVIATVITKHCTVHASDSFLTIKQPDNAYKVIEEKKTKIARLEAWTGAMAYWGLAELGHNRQPTIEWLREKGQEASRFKSAYKFAQYLTGKLNAVIDEMSMVNGQGVGIHLTVYEEIDNGCRVPELFRISNYKDTGYSTVNRVRCTRETYNILEKVETSKRHGLIEYRREVYRRLHENDGMLVYNNGDPGMFNPILGAILELFQQVQRSGSLMAPDNVETYRAIARTPIEVVAKAQEKFAKEGKRLVGGVIHDLLITEDGRYSSTENTS